MSSVDTKEVTARPTIRHMDTRHLRWATTFAMVVAYSTWREEVTASDLLAGLYVANFERISLFWPHPEYLEDFIAEYCDWSEPRWATWERYHEEHRRSARRYSILRWFGPLGRVTIRGKKQPRRFVGFRFHYSPDCNLVFETAEKLTPYTAKAPFSDKTVPLLTPEIVLLAFLRTEALPLGKSLRDSGLIVEQLEKAATRFIENPEKLLF
ncbi:MAG TPA: hypothetical protein VNZ63_00365 [Verrucomicrobiae bacterium]|jgi:hypothetical protein|nr:hypothetical protein [Verrucomicrobiae bacterium]